MTIRSNTITILIAALALAGCRATQRVDLADNGYADALSCIASHGGDSAWAGKQCGTRLFAYEGPQYVQGFRAALECAQQKGGTAEAAVSACARS